jgi:FkbM family methyltransferase
MYTFLRLLIYIDSVLQSGLHRLFGQKSTIFCVLEKITTMSVLTLLGEKFGVCKLWSLPDGKFLSSVNFFEWGGRGPEPELLGWINLRKGDIALDIGAHYGYYTLIFARKPGQTGLVIAVEPNPQCLQFLFSNIALNNLKNVQVIPYALSSKIGTTRLYKAGHRGLSTIMDDHGKGSIAVETMPLDSLLSEFPRIRLVKMDVENAELMILQCGQLLYKVERFIVEVHSKENMDSLLGLFMINGFRTKVIIERGQQHLVCDANA